MKSVKICESKEALSYFTFTGNMCLNCVGNTLTCHKFGLLTSKIETK